MTPAHLAISVVLNRLEALLDTEIAALSDQRPYDHDAAGRQKSRMLLELVRTQVSPEDAQSDPALSARLRDIREKLVRDQTLLELHVAASREVSAILSRVMQEVDWDGTYDSRVADRVPLK